MRPNRATLATVATLMLATAAPALAAGLSTSQAALASVQAARAVGKQTHAASVKVIGCNRITGAKALCHAEGRYRTGARRCTFDVTVSRVSTNGQRLRTSPSNFVCY